MINSKKCQGEDTKHGAIPTAIGVVEIFKLRVGKCYWWDPYAFIRQVQEKNCNQVSALMNEQ